MSVPNYQILIVTAKSAGALEGGVAVHSVVVGFDAKLEAEAAIANLEKFVAVRKNFWTDVCRLYGDKP